MPEIKVTIEGDERIRRILSNPEFIRGPLRVFLSRAGFIVEAKTKELAPVDTGRLRSSIRTEIMPMRAIVGPTVKYAAAVEFGSRPHWPTKGALQPWAERHGFPAGSIGDFLVRRLIARRGTRAHPFMRPGLKAAMTEIREEFQELKRAIAARWSGRAV
jgi:phage gpG-like protein